MITPRQIAPVVLFLDFDGVLHPQFPVPGPAASSAYFACVPMFEKAVRACPRPVQIVISSTWRKKRSLDGLCHIFSTDIAALVVGVTPVVDNGNEPGGRLREVQAWLDNNGGATREWVAIDDYPEVFAPGTPLVVCHDQFAKREYALLLEAVADPTAFAATYPVADYSEKRRVTVQAEYSRVGPP